MAIRPPVAEGGSRTDAQVYERVPPHNIEAEESVLGSMLLSKDAIAEVLELLHEDDFYRPAHRAVFQSILSLYSHGQAVDAVTVAELLRRDGALQDIGGAPFLFTLVSGVPTAANAAYYARIVKEAGVLRRLIDVGTRIVQLGFETPQDTERAVDMAESLVYQVAQGRVSEDYQSLHQVLLETMDVVDQLHNNQREITGIPTGFDALDRITAGLQNSNLIIVAARPGVGKSTLGLDIARNTAVREKIPTAVFSLEMSKTELALRLICAECGLDMQKLRTGRMSQADFDRLVRHVGKLADAPLFIDDSAHITMMEIRAKSRRLKQRHGLGLVVVDYLQLMQAGRRFENRQQEVSDISRSLKLLAKELAIPVIAISQLSRQTEARSDRRPLLSDLRESGCLTADTRVLRADTGAESSLGELLARGERNIPVWSVDEDLKMVPATMTHVFPSGVKPVFELRLASGLHVNASGNHPFLTLDGWKRLDQLRVGTRIAVPRVTPQPRLARTWPESEVRMLAHLLGDGGFGLNGLRSHETFIPEEVFTLSRDLVALFVRHLWATDGSVQLRRNGLPVIYYASSSRRLIEDLRLLLLRFGIVCRLKEARKAGHRIGYRLYAQGAENQLRFAEEVGVHGARGELLKRLIPVLRARCQNTNVDSVPVEVRSTVRASMVERGARVATVLTDDRLQGLAETDVFWDGVVAIQPLGEQEVYDATVIGPHNFVANGISVHNSLEQDADVVLFIYREELYDQESPRKGEADFILAKHRNGPTDTVTVTFQGQYSRFAPMAARSL